jgi:hypothetical protein
MSEFTDERDAAFRSMDVEWARKQVRMADPYANPSDLSLTRSLHKGRYEVPAMGDMLRNESRKWLEDHGFGRLNSLPWPPEGVLE